MLDARNWCFKHGHLLPPSPRCNATQRTASSFDQSFDMSPKNPKELAICCCTRSTFFGGVYEREAVNVTLPLLWSRVFDSVAPIELGLATFVSLWKWRQSDRVEGHVQHVTHTSAYRSSSSFHVLPPTPRTQTRVRMEKRKRGACYLPLT
jgi:hypothetical protein